ncbi:unnamed protein product, partial [Thlaspi arvense]
MAAKTKGKKTNGKDGRERKKLHVSESDSDETLARADDFSHLALGSPVELLAFDLVTLGGKGKGKGKAAKERPFGVVIRVMRSKARSYTSENGESNAKCDKSSKANTQTHKTLNKRKIESSSDVLPSQNGVATPSKKMRKGDRADKNYREQETKSAESAMAESSSLMLKATELFATPCHEALEHVLSQLCLGQETTEFKAARALYNYCSSNLADSIAIKLLKVYRFSSNGVVRFQSLFLLSELLSELRNRNFELPGDALDEIKPLLLSCLTMQETDESEIVIFRRIVAFVTYNVMILDDGRWDELSDCIFEFADIDPIKAFHVFVDLPPVYANFIYRFMHMILEKAEKVLLNPEQDRAGDWSLALETLVKLGIQLLDSELRIDVVKNVLAVLVKSASELVEKGMEQFLLRGLEGLERFLVRDKDLFNYNKEQCDFVSGFMFKIRELGEHTKDAAKKINRLVKSLHNPVTILQQPQGQPQEQPQEQRVVSDRERFNTLNSLSPLEILRIFESNDQEESFRDMAIRRLNLLLSEHTSKDVEIEISVIRELQPLLISCLSKEGISESMFKVLGEVVYHVAYEMMNLQVEVWYGLRDYLVSKSQTEFERAVYIFQCLTIWLEEDKFVVPVMESLLPEITARLNPPTEVLVDNSCWVLAFVGAFCAIIHMLEITSRAESVKEIADKIIDSVIKLVERGMEVGLVRRGFRDVESIVKKHDGWFANKEYEFVKGLVQRLYEIKGMTMESKMVLWRINLLVDRGVAEFAKQIP